MSHVIYTAILSKGIKPLSQTRVNIRHRATAKLRMRHRPHGWVTLQDSTSGSNSDKTISSIITITTIGGFVRLGGQRDAGI